LPRTRPPIIYPTTGEILIFLAIMAKRKGISKKAKKLTIRLVEILVIKVNITETDYFLNFLSHSTQKWASGISSNLAMGIALRHLSHIP
jgi:hypothetical protein